MDNLWIIHGIAMGFIWYCHGGLTHRVSIPETVFFGGVGFARAFFGYNTEAPGAREPNQKKLKV